MGDKHAHTRQYYTLSFVKSALCEFAASRGCGWIGRYTSQTLRHLLALQPIIHCSKETGNDVKTNILVSRLFAAGGQQFCGTIIFELGFQKDRNRHKNIISLDKTGRHDKFLCAMATWRPGFLELSAYVHIQTLLITRDLLCRECFNYIFVWRQVEKFEKHFFSTCERSINQYHPQNGLGIAQF